jgi:hypothetical protein
MFWYESGEQAWNTANIWYCYCEICGSALELKETYNKGNCGSFTCRCGALYIVTVNLPGEMKRWRFIDETNDKLPAPFEAYRINNAFLLKADKEGILKGVMWNHADSNPGDKFAFGKGVMTRTPEQIVFDDMDKAWE